jgi:hypothetical protein
MSGVRTIVAMVWRRLSWLPPPLFFKPRKEDTKGTKGGEEHEGRRKKAKKRIQMAEET